MYVIDYEIDFKHYQWAAGGDHDAWFLYFLLTRSRQARTGIITIIDGEGCYYDARHGVPLRSLADKDRDLREHPVKQWGVE